METPPTDSITFDRRLRSNSDPGKGPPDFRSTASSLSSLAGGLHEKTVTSRIQTKALPIEHRLIKVSELLDLGIRYEIKNEKSTRRDERATLDQVDGVTKGGTTVFLEIKK